ncbi:MAG: hypothetical protein P857_1038 [Candidatus Xenolissoclinum pacificiensis L6]|uniref:Uncharacterized protein n=1 Tax=Candidatus Xenolissoclinum pacificiensis L6 TaxID=1401685 RepID=W2V180_9RICK|nr:MAG: hypothetical protein P857_1038 [Candidatus Xenolissoclinum pacificiensis L6]
MILYIVDYVNMAGNWVYNTVYSDKITTTNENNNYDDE